MILEDKPIFNEPLIKISTKKVQKKNWREKCFFNDEP